MGNPIKKHCWKPFNNFFRKHGNKALVIVTIFQIIFYVAYTVIYCLKAQQQNKIIEN